MVGTVVVAALGVAFICVVVYSCLCVSGRISEEERKDEVR